MRLFVEKFKSPLTPLWKRGTALPLSYQLKGKILEIYVLNSVRSEMFIA
jgi:hypothetical protein